MSADLAKQVRATKRLERAWETIRENARSSRSVDTQAEVEHFAADAPSKLRSIQGRLVHGSFRFEPARGAAIPKLAPDGKRRKGKIRPIVIAPLESRIVQRSILDVLCEVPALADYVNTPNSFGGLKKLEARRGAVPAAIEAVVDAIHNGGQYLVSADIQAFFTRISKSRVSDIIAGLIDDDAFMPFFREALRVELNNMAGLREYVQSFPIHDIGVAQGNSLSPLLGNVILHGFDAEMNDGDCRCIRYIDDFIVLAPSHGAARARLRRATELLGQLGMELSPEKSSREPAATDRPFTFLGIEVANGLLRPSAKARAKLLANLDGEFSASQKAFAKARKVGSLDHSRSLIATLKRIDGIINGWGKHYRFCNDKQVFKYLDGEIAARIGSYISAYGAERARLTSDSAKHNLLGIQQLAEIELDPIQWRPRTSAAEPTGLVSSPLSEQDTA